MSLGDPLEYLGAIWYWSLIQKTRNWSNDNLKLLFESFWQYRESPTYGVFTTADPTTKIFGLCAQVGNFTLVEDPYSPTKANFAIRGFFQVPKSA